MVFTCLPFAYCHKTASQTYNKADVLTYYLNVFTYRNFIITRLLLWNTGRFTVSYATSPGSIPVGLSFF